MSTNDPTAILERDRLTYLVKAERRAAIIEERRRFSVELHDVVAGWLQAAILHLADVRQSLQDDDGRALDLLTRIEAEIRGCWDDARRSAAALRPAGLEPGGLARALEEYVRRVSDSSTVAVAFNTCGTPQPLSPDAEAALLRVGQEAVSNALRYADAAAISVEVAFDAEAVRLEVVDDGHGFAPDRAGGAGMAGMRDRARRVGGELTIHTEPDQGTQVVVTVPVGSLPLVIPAPGGATHGCGTRPPSPCPRAADDDAPLAAAGPSHTTIAETFLG